MSEPQSLICPQITCDLRSLDEESLRNTFLEQERLGWPDVTDQEKLFVVKYLVSFNHRKAAEEVGLDPESSLKMLRDPLINAYAKWMRKGIEARDLLTREMVAHRWLEAIPELRGDEAVPCVTKDGEEVMARKYHGPELIRALVELSKISGLTPTEEMGKKAGVQVTLNFGGLLAPGAPLPPIEVITE